MAKFVTLFERNLSGAMQSAFVPLRDEIPSVVDSNSWSLDENDQFVAADLDGDGIDELVVHKGNDRIGVIKKSGASLGMIFMANDRVGNWRLNRDDEYYVGDFDDDGNDEIVIRRGNSRIGLFKFSPNRQMELVTQEENSISGVGDAAGQDWPLRSSDRYVVARVDANFSHQLVVRRRDDRVGIIFFDAAERRFRLRWKKENRIDGAHGLGGDFWRLNARDEYEVGDFDGDGADEILVHKGNDRVGVLKWHNRQLSLFSKNVDQIPGSNRAEGLVWPIDQSDRYSIAKFDNAGEKVVIAKDDDRVGILEWRHHELTVLSRQNGRIGGVGASGPVDWRLDFGDEFLAGNYIGQFDQVFVRNTGRRYEFLGRELVQDGEGRVGILEFRNAQLELTWLERVAVPILPVGGWHLRKRDRYFVGRFRSQFTDQLFVYQPSAQKSRFRKFISFIGNAFLVSGRMLRAIVNRTIGIFAFISCLLGLPTRTKRIGIRVRVLRDEFGRPVVNLENSDELTPLLRQLERVNEIFEREADVTVKGVPHDTESLFATLMEPAPTSALEPSCDSAGWIDELSEAREYFSRRIDRGTGFRGRVLGRGRDVTVFVVRDVRAHGGCASPSRDYVVIGVEVASREDSTTMAHEIGHSCDLMHRPKDQNNLMNTGAGRGDHPTLHRWQKCIVRGSRNVTR